MLEAIPYAGASLLVIAAWAAGLAAFDVFTPDDVKAWRRLAGMRGYATPRGRLEKAASKSTWIRNLQERLDLNRLLGIVGRTETPLQFLGRTALQALGTMVVVVIFELLYYRWNGDWILGVGPWIVLPIGVMAFMLMLGDLGSKARKRQEAAGRSLGDMMMLVAIMTDGRGLQLEDAVRILARCVEDEALEAIVDKRGWQRLVRVPYRNTIELYRLIGEEYTIPAFVQIADAAANANVGFSERETYTRLAKAVYAQRLAEARQKAARAKILVTLPVAGMLIPLLVLLGAPTFSSIATGLGAH